MNKEQAIEEVKTWSKEHKERFCEIHKGLHGVSENGEGGVYVNGDFIDVNHWIADRLK